LRPDRVRGVVGLSVPYRPRGSAAPLGRLRAAVGEGFYQIYFQAPGVADAELARDVRRTMRRVLYSASGNAPRRDPPVPPVVPAGRGFLDIMVDPPTLPGWLTEHDVDVFTDQFQKSGFNGGLNWYRNIDRNWELTAPWHGAHIQPPALYVAGERDLVLTFPGARELIAGLAAYVPNLRRTVILPGCGHWTQQERPAEVNAAMLEFLAGLDGAGKGS
jgi:pimeloyl-ACP methyl ester carboxylesterase